MDQADQKAGDLLKELKIAYTRKAKEEVENGKSASGKVGDFYMDLNLVMEERAQNFKQLSNKVKDFHASITPALSKNALPIKTIKTMNSAVKTTLPDLVSKKGGSVTAHTERRTSKSGKGGKGQERARNNGSQMSAVTVSSLLTPKREAAMKEKIYGLDLLEPQNLEENVASRRAAKLRLLKSTLEKDKKNLYSPNPKVIKLGENDVGRGASTLTK